MEYEKTTKAPSLITAPIEYEQQYQNQYNKVLRLYFNEIDENNRLTFQKIRNLSVMTWLSTGSF